MKKIDGLADIEIYDDKMIIHIDENDLVLENQEYKNGIRVWYDIESWTDTNELKILKFTSFDYIRMMIVTHEYSLELDKVAIEWMTYDE